MASRVLRSQQRRFVSRRLLAVMVAAALTTSGAVVGSAQAAEPAASEPGSPSGVDETSPDIFIPPADVNRTPVGETPDGVWTSQLSGEVIAAGSEGEAQSRGSAPVITPESIEVATPADDAVAAPGLGIQGFYGITDFQLDELQSVGVNLGNGNLLVKDTDAAVNGPGIGMHLDRFYNGLSARVGAFGPKWSISAGTDIGLEVSPTNIIFRAPSGFRATFVPTTGGNYTSPSGINADLVKLSTGTFTLTYRSNSEKLSFTAGGFLTSDADRNGNTLTCAYNTDDTLASVTDAAGRVTTLAYTGGKLMSITDPASRITRFEYDSASRLSQVTNAQSFASTYSYDTAGRLKYIKTARGSQTEIGYDTAGRVTTLKRFLTLSSTSGPTSTTTFAYGAGSTVVTDPNAHAATYAVDTAGRVTQTTDPLGRVHAQTWTSNSSVATATDAMGAGGGTANITTYSYDASNNPISVALPTGATAAAVYTGGGTCGSTDIGHPYQPKCSTDASGNKAQFTYDTAGNMLKKQDTTSGATGGVAISYTYQGTAGITCGGKTGQMCSSTNGAGAVTTYAYDSSGNVTTVTPPAPLGATTLTYDSIGRVTGSVDGKGQSVSYFYDALDHPTQTTYSTGSVQWFYNTDGFFIDGADPAGPSTGAAYDALNRQTAAKPDNLFIDLAVTLEAAGNTTKYTDGSGDVVYTYDNANQLVAIAEPGGTCPATGTGTKCTRIEYDYNGNQTKITYPGGTTQTTTRDNSGRATRIQAKNSAATILSDFSYSYTAAGGTGPTADRAMIQKRTDNLGLSAASIPAGAVTTYTYDTLSRLTAATEKTAAGAANAAWNYGYSTSGNRTSQTRTGNTGTTAGTTNYGYNAADQLTTISSVAAGLSYDGNGNETASPGAPTLGVAARTDTLGVRDQVASITTGGASTAFTYANTSNTLRFTAGTTSFQNGMLGVTATTSATTSYTRAPSGALISQRTPTGASNYYLTDIQGSVVGLVDATGAKVATYAYDPYGITRYTTGTAAPTNPYRYTSGYTDPTGLIKYGARYYDPTTARFTQPDPSGQEQNRYLYTGANPTNNTDPSGLSFGNFLKGAAFVVGIVSDFIPGVGGVAGGLASGALDAAGDLANGGSWGEAAGSFVESGLIGAVSGAVGTIAGAGRSAGTAWGLDTAIGVTSDAYSACDEYC